MGCEILGTISQGREVAALVRLDDSGNLAKVIKGEVMMVNQAEVQRLLDAARNPKPTPEMLPADHWQEI